MLFGETGGAAPHTPKVPQNVDGWTLTEGPRVYERGSLFDYINGGAELYLAYSFEKLSAFRFSTSEGPDIILDIFEMASSQDAFGVFSAEREGPDTGIGQGSEYDGWLLRFWKGPYFVSIVALGDAPRSKDAVQSLGVAVAESIHETGRPPALVGRLPPDGLQLETVKYVRSHHLLNMLFFVSTENILGIGHDTDVVLARYDEGSKRPCLLLAQYPTPVHAEWARGGFKDSYMPDATDNAVETENGTWTASAIYGNVVAIVFDAPSRMSAMTILDRVAEQGG
jgi:hypothetical protein